MDRSLHKTARFMLVERLSLSDRALDAIDMGVVIVVATTGVAARDAPATGRLAVVPVPLGRVVVERVAEAARAAANAKALRLELVVLEAALIVGRAGLTGRGLADRPAGVVQADEEAARAPAIISQALAAPPRQHRIVSAEELVEQARASIRSVGSPRSATSSSVGRVVRSHASAPVWWAAARSTDRSCDVEREQNRSPCHRWNGTPNAISRKRVDWEH